MKMIQNQKLNSRKVAELEILNGANVASVTNVENIEKREIDCLCCQEVDTLNSKFDCENTSCVIKSIELQTLCINKLVLENVLTGLHELWGDYMEKTWSNWSLRYAAYKQFIWWVFKSLSKGKRRVIPSCTLWRIRKLYPEPNKEYNLYSEG